MGILDFLNDTADRAAADLKTAIAIEKATTFPKPSSLALEKPLWKRIEDTVVVATDLKGSTRISYSKQDRVGARVYQASSGHCARIFQHFDADFVDIQGDGLFAIFHGEHAVGRATAAAFTLKSFSTSALARLIDEHLGKDLPEGYETGLKVGIDTGVLLAKRIGVRGDHNEPVWAGKPVNYATKCAQGADRHEIIVTDRFWNCIKSNDYASYTCGCAGGEASSPAPMWSETEIKTLGDDAACKTFSSPSSWCVNHGDEFCAAIRSGLTDRADVNRSELPEFREAPPAAA
jgi:class 3 adenylate cyclase